MPGSRPWWFPTAMVSAPGGALLFATSLAIGTWLDAPDWIVAIPLFAGLTWPVVDLAMRESRARDSGRLPPIEVTWRERLIPIAYWPVTMYTAMAAVGMLSLLMAPFVLPWRDLAPSDVILVAISLWIFVVGVARVRERTHR